MHHVLVYLLVFVFAVSCSSAATQQATIVQPTPTDRPEVRTAFALATQVSKPTTTIAVTSTPKPTYTPQITATHVPTWTPAATPTSQAALVLGEQGYGQDGQELAYAFIVSNPGIGAAITTSSYQAAAYDESGAVLKTSDGYVDVVLPGETIGVAGTMYFEKGQKATKVEVQLHSGDTAPMAALGGAVFEASNIKYVAGEYASKVTGSIASHFTKDVEQVRVSAICKDADGKIIGGGMTYVQFIPANGQAAVEVRVTTAGDVVSTELYPVLSNLSLNSLDK